MSRIVYSFTNITDLHSRGVLKGTSDGGSQNVIVFTNNTTLIRSNNNACTEVFHCKSVGLKPPENVVFYVAVCRHGNVHWLTTSGKLFY